MHVRMAMKLTALVLGIIFVLSLAALPSSAQVQVFQAVAKGTGEQMRFSQGYGVEITIESYSGPEDQKFLWDAFTQGGNAALADALKKLPKRGSISLTGEAPYDITYAREILNPDGSRVVRVVAKRFVTAPEVHGRAPWSADFNISAAELQISPQKSKNTGVFLPACQFVMDKEKGLQIQLREEAWKLDYLEEKTKK